MQFLVEGTVSYISVCGLREGFRNVETLTKVHFKQLTAVSVLIRVP